MLLGGSNLIVGLAFSLQGFGQMLTPMVVANLISHRRRVLPIGFMVGAAMRFCVLLMGVAGLVLGEQGTLIAIICLMGLFGVFEGMQGVVFNFLMSKVIPVSKRGRLTGLRNFLACITSAAVAYLGGTYLIGEESSVTGYSLTFILAFVLTTIGLISLIAAREPQLPTVRRQVSGSVGPLLGGARATWYGYESVFIAAIFFVFVGAMLVYFYVP